MLWHLCCTSGWLLTLPALFRLKCTQSLDFAQPRATRRGNLLNSLASCNCDWRPVTTEPGEWRAIGISYVWTGHVWNYLPLFALFMSDCTIACSTAAPTETCRASPLIAFLCRDTMAFFLFELPNVEVRSSSWQNKTQGTRPMLNTH